MTVVVPTHRRPVSLAALLEAVAAQADPGVPWSVLVIDNEDAPGAERVFAEHVDALPVPARLVREPQKGASRARNRGIAEADGEIIAFLDDDVIPHPDWLREVIGPIVAGRCEGVGGRVELDESVPRPSWLWGSATAYLAAYDRGDQEIQLDDDDYLLTANAAFLTSLLRMTPGFDPALGPQPGTPTVNDDVDICRSFRSVGGRLRYAPAAVVVHELPPERLRVGYMVRRSYAQGRSDYLLDRDRLAAHRFGGLKGRGIEAIADVGRIGRRGPWRPWVAMALLTSCSRSAGFTREVFRHNVSKPRARV